MDAYNPDIDYKVLLTRYLKYLYKDWIANPEFASKYPHMVDHEPVFEFVKHESGSPWGDIIVRFCVRGDMYRCNAECKPDDNETYYDMLNKAVRFGISIMTSNDISTSSYNFVHCEWTALEMMEELDKMGIH